MKTESIYTGRPVSVGELTISPIIRVSIRCEKINSLVLGSASQEPVAVLIISRQGKRILNLDGEEVPLEQFKEVKGVKELLWG